MGADGFIIPLALQQHALCFDDRPFGIVLILIDAALIAGLRPLPAGTEHIGGHVNIHIRAIAICRRRQCHSQR